MNSFLNTRVIRLTALIFSLLLLVFTGCSGEAEKPDSLSGFPEAKDTVLEYSEPATTPPTGSPEVAGPTTPPPSQTQAQ